jgi:predicted restriction endonuclease
MYEGVAYPVKPLGRFANALAGRPMKENPITNVFRDRFAKLKFRLIDSPEAEAEQAVERQRKLAQVLARPQQAKFRREVFMLWGARCLITKCETLSALEAAHIHRVSDGGSDDPWNGIPLRADIHRLFDANLITLSSEGWIVTVTDGEPSHYRKFHGRSLAKRIGKSGRAPDLAAMLRERDVR